MGSELVNPTPPFTYTEQFYELFPFYLSIGMTFDQYWNDDCALTVHYRKAHELRTKRKNHEMWLQGLYVYDALCSVSPILQAFAKKGTKPLPYPELPYPISDKEAKEREEERQRANRKKAMASFATWAAQLDLPENTKREE